MKVNVFSSHDLSKLKDASLLITKIAGENDIILDYFGASSFQSDVILR